MLKPARFKNFYGGLLLTKFVAAYGSLKRQLRGLSKLARCLL